MRHAIPVHRTKSSSGTETVPSTLTEQECTREDQADWDWEAGVRRTHFVEATVAMRCDLAYRFEAELQHRIGNRIESNRFEPGICLASSMTMTPRSGG